MKHEQCKREADRRLKPPADFWSWCYSQITTYKWSNKDKTIIASDLDLGHCIEKRLTKSSRLTFYDKTYFFSIILSTSKRIEIQSYEFSSKLVEGKQFIDWQFTNLERFENDKHLKIGQDYNGQFYPYLFANFFSGGYYTGNVFYPNNWEKRLQKVSELKYLKFDNIYFWEIERLYKYKFEIEFAQKIHAYRLANEIMFPNYRIGFTRTVDMRTLNRRWLQKNKQFFKNSNRSFNEFELSRRLKERNGQLVPGIESYLTYHDIKHIPKGLGSISFRIGLSRIILTSMNILTISKCYEKWASSLKAMLCLYQRILLAMHNHTVGLYNQFVEERRKLEDKKKRKQLEAEFKLKKGMDRTIHGYAFHVPIKVAELIYEGKKLHHCVSSYTDKHFKGDTLIVFVRLSNQPKKPLYTLEVKQGKIVQFRGKYNEDVPKDVWDIANEWMKQTKLVSKAA
ncbi:PcfJ domain-containing protein [Streptococcus phage SM1]|uniref:PcfJ domain-containing protein n=1 Tax=Streptococcus phage SM1 TaxID=157924 RepID=UPI00001B04B6|nr:PcfJ domain-containing protein [Streptococcus phage SM1]AAP81905.1 gp23 [Streptococcus phage SM1]